MAPRLPKRTLQPEEMRRPERVLEVINQLSERMTDMLAGGISYDNLKRVVVSAKVTAPDPWTPLVLSSSFARHPSLAFPPPAYEMYEEASRNRVRLRGLLTRPGAAPPLGTVIATDLPPASWQSRHVTDAAGLHAMVESRTNGTLTYGSGLTDALSLEGITYETAAVRPLWPSPVDVTLKGENGQDYGEPFQVFCLGATRKDRVPVHPEDTPVWEAPLLGEGRVRERKLRIRRLDGLAAGVEHVVTFLCLYV